MLATETCEVMLFDLLSIAGKGGQRATHDFVGDDYQPRDQGMNDRPWHCRRHGHAGAAFAGLFGTAVARTFAEGGTLMAHTLVQDKCNLLERIALGAAGGFAGTLTLQALLRASQKWMPSAAPPLLDIALISRNGSLAQSPP